MLNVNEIAEIERLIKEGFGNYRIHKETGHHVTVIKKIREKMEKTAQEQIHKEEMIVKSPIDIIMGFIKEMDILVEKKHLDEREEKTWGKRKEQLRDLITTEVNDRISDERKDAEQKRDQLWRNTIKQRYVEKEEVKPLQNTIEEQNKTIRKFKADHIQKDAEHEEDQKKIMRLLEIQRDNENQIWNLTAIYNALNNTNFELNSYIYFKLDTKVKQGQEELKQEWDKFNAEKTRFDEFRKNQLVDLINKNTESEKREKAVEIREQQVAERERQIQTEKGTIEIEKMQWDKNYTDLISAVKKRVEDIAYAHCHTMVQKCFEKQINDLKQQWRELQYQKDQLKKEQEMLTRNHR